jgi:hypothetical protein
LLAGDFLVAVVIGGHVFVLVSARDYPRDKQTLANCWLSARKKNAENENNSKEATTEIIVDTARIVPQR